MYLIFSSVILTITLKTILFYNNKDLRTVRLAPCYDVVATRVYKTDINEMSLSINGKLNMDEVTRADCNGNEITNGVNIKYF